jgi:perosamine synthetase
VLDFCNQHNIYLIEDVSHCHGSKLKHSYLGTLGHVSIFSMQERKLVTTGEGGLILTQSDEISESIEKMRNFGRASTNKTYFEKKIDDFGNSFGLNFRMSALNAALGVSQLNKLDKKIASRTNNANYLKSKLNKIPWFSEIPILDGCTPNYYSIVFKISDTKYSNFKFGKYLEKNNVISDTFRYDFQPLYQMKLFHKYASHCPNAEGLSKSIFTLPTHEGLTKAELRNIVKIVKNYVPEY